MTVDTTLPNEYLAAPTDDRLTEHPLTEHGVRPESVVLLAVTPDIYLKSLRTQRGLRRVLRENLRAALDREAPGVQIDGGPPGRLLLRAETPEMLRRGAEAAIQVFGVYWATEASVHAIESLDDLEAAVVPRVRDRIAGRTFAMRVRRRGKHSWRSQEAEIRLGSALIGDSAGVNLSAPEVGITVEVYDGTAYLMEEHYEGPDGLPLRSQERSLLLLSGGFDSPVAGWLTMRRGSPAEFLHFEMDCAQSEQAMAVCYELWRQWGHGTDPLAWTVDFADVKEALMTQVPSRYRQVALKRMMLAVADALAQRLDIRALVTGEALAQVSSQTLANLAEISRGCETLVLRPLTTMTKSEIMHLARRAGTATLSARAVETCNLADGPVETAARRGQVDETIAALPDDIVQHALQRLSVLRVADWVPGREPIPVVEEVPPGVAIIEQVADAPPGIPVVAAGPDAYEVALQLSLQQPVSILLPRVEDAPLDAPLRQAAQNSLQLAAPQTSR